MAFGIDDQKKSSGATRDFGREDAMERVLSAADTIANAAVNPSGGAVRNVAQGFGFGAPAGILMSPSSPLQQDTAKLTDRALLNAKRVAAATGVGLAKALHYTTGIDFRDAATNFDREVNPLAYGEVQQTGPVAKAEPAQPIAAGITPPAQPGVTQPAATTPAATTTAAQEHPWSKFKSVEEGARTLSDADFKRFVDANQDHPHVKGMGYIETGTPGTKGYRMERVFPSQGDKGGGGAGFGINQNLSAGQLHAIAPVLAAKHSDDLRRQHLDQLATANWFAHMDRQDKLAETTKLRKSEDFHKSLVAFSPSTPDDEKKPMIGVGMLRMMDRGMSPEHMPGFEVQARNLWDQREQIFVNEMKKKGIAYNPADINRVGTPTYNARMELIKHYENSMMGKK